MNYTENDKALIWLSLYSNLSLKKQNLLLSVCDQPTKLWQNFGAYKEKLLNVLSATDLSKLEFSKDDTFINNYIQNCNSQNITIITQTSKLYPKLLLETDLPPLVLYCKGNLHLLNSECVAVVGTRHPTRYGKEITTQFAAEFARAGLTVVSGLCDGVDSYAHRATLQEKGNTIAVLGGGLNEIYPQSNFDLAREIEKTGLIISEYKPNERPQRYYFPARNRIIAGLSKGILITEAGEKSGSLHTKNYAIEYNRNLFVVPGRINETYSKGCNNIIKNLQGSMVLSPQDVLSSYGLKQKNTQNFSQQLDLNDQIVLSLLSVNEEVHYETILIGSGLEPKILNTTLMRLELKGLIKKLAGNLYTK